MAEQEHGDVDAGADLDTHRGAWPETHGGRLVGGAAETAAHKFFPTTLRAR